MQRAGDVLSKVLTLSRLDASPVGISADTTAKVDLGEMLRDRAAEHTPQAMGCVIDLGLLESSSVLVSVKVSLLIASMNNLIDNALLYCPQGSHVDVSWGQEDAYACGQMKTMSQVLIRNSRHWCLRVLNGARHSRILQVMDWAYPSS
jgi:signal transduction histidine kinase